jgi:hypothetical protein
MRLYLGVVVMWETVGFVSWTKNNKMIKFKLTKPAVKKYFINAEKLNQLLTSQTNFVNVLVSVKIKTFVKGELVEKSVMKKRGYLNWSRSRNTILLHDNDRIVCIPPDRLKLLLVHKLPYVEILEKR